MEKTINSAMDAHSLWRSKLETAISKGMIETPIDTIASDNKCAFGQWLYGNEIPDEIKTSELFNEIKILHAAFHKNAAQIATLATTGKQSEAAVLLHPDGDYQKTSQKLIQLLIKLKKAAI